MRWSITVNSMNVKILYRIAMCCTGLGAARLSALDLYVSPSGDDTSSGAANAPLATIAGARDAIRSLKNEGGLPKGGVTVWLGAGYYNSLSTIAFDERDSGTETSPITYCAKAGEQVFITGGATLDPMWFKPVTSTTPGWGRIDPASRSSIIAVNLSEHGITDYGSIRMTGFNMDVPAPMELFFGGHPMELARWPKAGQPRVRTASAPSRTEFTYSGTRPSRWVDEKDVWLHGMWNTTWADYHIRVSSIDPVTKTIYLAEPPAQFGLGAKRPFYAYNILEELDQPGEYYLDRPSGILYFWPPGSIADRIAQVSILEDSLLKFDGASFVTLRGLTLEASRGTLLSIHGGRRVLAVNCLLRNGGESGAEVSGSDNGLDGCEVVDCGGSGVRISGGDRASLTAGNNFVTNSRIHQIARIAWTEHPGVSLEGCGNRASHNLIDEVPHIAVLFTGNNHVIEYNEIRRACLETSDSGVIYAGRDWGYRGNVIRFNFIHHIDSNQPGIGVEGVYLDDLMSGTTVFGNVFYRIKDTAIFCGGGRDNLMTNNIIARCGIGHYDGDYARSHVDNQLHSSWNLLERLAADGIQYQNEPWSSAYPGCAAIPNSWWLIQDGLWRNPQGCVYSLNVGWDNGRWLVESNVTHTGVFAVYKAMADNNPSEPALFDDEASLDRSRRPARLAASVTGFQPIAFASIGPAPIDRADASRPPPAPLLSSPAATPTSVDFRWTDYGNLPSSQESGFELQWRKDPTGPWTVLKALGPDSVFATASGLSPSQSFTARVRAYNAAGESFSNPVEVSTSAPPMVAGPASRFEAESSMSVLRSVGAKGKVGVISSKLASGGKCVSLFNPGDAVRIRFSVPTDGTYRLGVRVRSGDSNLPIGMSYWPDGYEFALDGGEVALRGEPSSVSDIDPSYGKAYWGTMLSGPLRLSAGPHSVDVASSQVWAMVDYLEVAPLSNP